MGGYTQKQIKMKDASSLEPWTRIPRPVLLMGINKAAITYHQPLFLTSQRKRVKMAVKNLCLSSLLTLFLLLRFFLLFCFSSVSDVSLACVCVRACARHLASFDVARVSRFTRARNSLF